MVMGRLQFWWKQVANKAGVSLTGGWSADSLNRTVLGSLAKQISIASPATELWDLGEFSSLGAGQQDSIGREVRVLESDLERNPGTEAKGKTNGVRPWILGVGSGSPCLGSDGGREGK